MNITEEIWKSLEFVDCPGYEVSNLGRVRNIKVKTKRIIKGFLNRKVHPYRQVLLCTSENKPKAFRVGRLVALAFVPNPDPINKLFVDHIDGDSLNDVATNLRWVTASENMRNPITVERCKKNHRGFKKGNTPWNKGFTKEDYTEEHRRNLSIAAKGCHYKRVNGKRVRYYDNIQ